MRLALWIPAFALLTTSGFAQTNEAVVSSPDKQLVAKFEIVEKQATADTGRLVYSIAFEGKPLIDRSGLSLNLQGQRPLGDHVRILNAAPSTVDDTYELVTGKASKVRDHYNAMRLELSDDRGDPRRLAIEARVYDDAVAFRYVVPDQSAFRELRLKSEDTEFRFHKDAESYALILPHFRTMYEGEFVKLPASAFAGSNGLSTSNALIGLPYLLHVQGVAWVAITEANLRDYSSMYLTSSAKGWGGADFISKLAPGDDPDVVVAGALPHHSAWRIVMVGETPGRLIESNVISSLNPPSEIQDTSWIHSGLTTWDWWSGSLNKEGQSAFTTDTMKYYVDFAARSHFPYILIDAGWSEKGDITKMNGKVDVPEVVKYAAAKNVKVWIWLSYHEADAQMEQAFPLYEKWGVAGLKIDFVERDDQRGIDFYYRAAKQAAAHHLMVDFHGATKPTGVERTYPNIMGYEAVLGMEQNKANARDTPEHRVTLPFTRMLAGRMDYTPGGFRNVTAEQFEIRDREPVVMGTRAAQLAMYVVYEAPFQMVSDTPKAYEDQPAFSFIEHAPTTWDETDVIDGLPGEYITMARRKGTEWFLGSMTDWTPREMDVPLSFLGSGKYTAEIYADAPDAGKYPKGVEIFKKTVDRSMSLHLKLAPGGGCAVRFLPVR